MKQYEIYRNIRKRAVIFGLPISLFALMMISVVASLLVIIFSFSFGIIIGVIVLNMGLYIALIRVTNNPQLFHFSKPFPQKIFQIKPFWKKPHTSILRGGNIWSTNVICFLFLPKIRRSTTQNTSTPSKR